MSVQKETFLRIHQHDNVLVALQNLEQGTMISFEGNTFALADRIAAKHKFAINELPAGHEIYMYGVLVGKATSTIPQGGLLSTQNVHHASDGFHLGERKLQWHQPDTGNFEGKTFKGYHRADGSVGTSNYWIVVPLVFCENRNINVLKEALVDKLGYKKAKSYEGDVEQLMELYQAGKSVEEILNADIQASTERPDSKRLFKNIDGIKFLNHSMGCGGTKDDSDALCGLIAGYITHPNVAGATILSLGCQHAQVSILQAEIAKRDPAFSKPIVVLEQQKVGTESELLQQALKQTFAGLVQANQTQREPAPL
ncbi:MAG TPA: UxaA family hydrolase, partial [Mucilaginibacter sp.]|nr:UxaA family hydrolase [Mucilaginibacter sp.]